MPQLDEMMELQWKEELLETPLFTSYSIGKIEIAGAFSYRLRELGWRVGYTIPARGYNFRAKGLYLISTHAIYRRVFLLL